MKRSLILMAGLLLAGTIATNAQVVDNTTPLHLEAQYGQINDTSQVPTMGTQEWQNAIAASLNVYPNPSAGEFVVHIPLDIHLSEIAVYDLTGRVVKEKRGQKIIGASGTSIDLTQNPSGIYLLVLRNGADTYVHRLVKY